jgi:lambda repressor-like predicted transcriptional regulator
LRKDSSSIPWNPKDITLALRNLGWSNKRLADELHMPASSIPYALEMGTSKSLRDLVEKLTGVSAAEIWPARFPPQWRKKA